MNNPRAAMLFLLCAIAGPQFSWGKIQKISELNGISTYKLDQPLDHSNPKAGVFDQRIFVVHNPNAKKDAPIFIESTGVFTTDAPSLAQREYETFARPLGAHLVLVEHRLTGKSLPEQLRPVSKRLAFFNLFQVVEDLATAQRATSDLLPGKGKWFAIGGSYTASIALLLAETYPATIDGVYASSPSHPGLGAFTARPIERIEEILGKPCSTKIEKLIAWTEQALEGASRERISEFGRDVFGTSLSIEQPEDVFFVIMNITAMSAENSEMLCRFLDRSFADPKIDPLIVLAKLARPYRENYGDAFLETNAGITAGLEEKATEIFQMSALWRYLACSELGSMWIASPKTRLLSAKVSESYYTESCRRLFGIDPSKTKEDAWIGNKIAASMTALGKVLITDGWKDPWSIDGLIPQEHVRVGKNGVYYRRKDGTHCSDRVPPDEGGLKLQKSALNLLNSW